MKANYVQGLMFDMATIQIWAAGRNAKYCWYEYAVWASNIVSLVCLFVKAVYFVQYMFGPFRQNGGFTL